MEFDYLLTAQAFTVLLSIVCSWLMAHQRIEAFYVGTIANFLYIGINFYIGTHVVIVSYIVFTVMNMYAIRTWQKLRNNQSKCSCNKCGLTLEKSSEVVSD